jgi:hypothetical protein
MNRIIDLIISFFKKKRERAKKIDSLLENKEKLDDALAGRQAFTDTIIQLDKRLYGIEEVQKVNTSFLQTILLIVDRRRRIETVPEDHRKKITDKE